MSTEEFYIGLKRRNVTVTGKHYGMLSVKCHNYENAKFCDFCMTYYKSTELTRNINHYDASWAAMICSIITRKDLAILKN